MNPVHFTAQDYRDAKAGVRRCAQCQVPLELDEGLDTWLCDYCDWLEVLKAEADQEARDAWLDALGQAS